MEFTANKYIVPKIKYKMDNKRLLIIVDGQYDFINGSLAVNGAKEKMDELSTFIDTTKREYSAIVLTADWHPRNHCSFGKNGGIWPTHCVEFTHGASIYQPIIEALDGVEYSILTKGINKEEEEYSIFKNEKSKSYLINLCETLGISDVDICGIALDVCVLETLKNGTELLPNVKFNLLKAFSPYITEDGAEKVYEFVSNAKNINII